MAQSVFDLFTPVATWIGGSQHCFEAGITPGDVGKELPCWWVSSLEVLFLALCRAFLSEPVKRVFTFEHIGSSTMCRLPVFYQQVLAAWLLTGNRDHLENLTSKITYRCIQPAVTHRYVTKFADYHLDWPALWPDLDFFFVDKPIWKSNFLILHGILPTVDRLARWGIEPRNPRCHCGQPETQEHLLEHCPLTLILVGWFKELLGCKWPGYSLSNAHTRFGHLGSTGFPAGFKFILATLRHYVWVARNLWQFEGTRLWSVSFLGSIGSVVWERTMLFSLQ